MKETISVTGAEFISDLSLARANNKVVSVPGFPDHLIAKVEVDDCNTSRIIVLGEKACGSTTIDYLVASFPTTDTPLELSYLAIGEVELGDDTI